MKVSIVTISFNQAPFLEQAIKSVIEQDYPDIEYIVVDPGSSDNSREIIERYRYGIDTVIFEPDNGPADGLNKGFAVATGDIYGFLNADDFLLPGAIRTITGAFESMPDKDVISGHAYIVNDIGTVLRRSYSRRFSAFAYIYGAATIAQQSTFFKASAFKRTSGFNVDNRVAWDAELWVTLARVGAKFSRLNAFLACFRVYPQSVTGSGQASGEIGQLYQSRIFQYVRGRQRKPVDKLLRIVMKVIEYASDPPLLLERLIHGRTIPLPKQSIAQRADTWRERKTIATDRFLAVPIARLDFLTRHLYRLYSVLGRPVFAVPAQPRYLRRVALQRLLPFTPKRAVYQKILQFSMLVRADWLFSHAIKAPLEDGYYAFDFEAWLQQMRDYFNVPKVAAAIVWPKQISRGRVYVHLLDGSHSIGFAKISLLARNQAKLSREAATLREMNAKHLQTYRVPRLLIEGQMNGNAFLVLEPLPAVARPISRNRSVFPHMCVKEYSGLQQRISGSMAAALTWWHQYQYALDEECAGFVEELNDLMDCEFNICRAHGDLSAHNMAYDGCMLWIYDWEESVLDAPALTDALSFEMSLNISAVRAAPRAQTYLFKRKYVIGAKRQDRLAIMMALAFRHAAEIKDATLVMQNWNRTK